jgi:hypothetical protein
MQTRITLSFGDRGPKRILEVLSSSVCYRKVAVVRDALEDRDFPQDPQLGLQAEEVRLRAAERIVNLIAILCLLSWRVFWMTMINRTLPEAMPELALTPTEIYLLDQLVNDKPGTAPSANTALPLPDGSVHSFSHFQFEV